MKKIIKHPAVLIALILIFLTGGYFGAVYIAKPIYVTWRNNNLITQAQELYDAEDYDTAFIAIRKVLIQSEDIQVWDLALKIIQRVPSQVPNIPSYLKKLIELDPENPDNYASFCIIALSVRQPAIAKETFNTYPMEARNTALYHEIGFKIASSMAENDEAKKHLKELLILDPGNTAFLYSLYVFDLQAEDETLRQNAVEDLMNLANEDSFKLRVYRVLLTHFIISGDSDNALVTASLLENIEDIELRDNLIIAQAFNLFDSTRFETKWAEIQNLEFTSEIEIILILDFLIQNQKLKIASEWAKSIPDEFKQSTSISQKLGQVYYLNQDWETLQNYLEGFSHSNDEGWKDKEFGRLLLLSLASRLQGRDMEFNSYWEKMLIAVGNDKSNLKRVFTQALRWGWPNEAITVIERSFQLDASDNQTFSILVNYYMKTGKTANLLDVLAKRIEFVPDDKNSINNFAIISFLLRRRTTLAYTYAQKNFKSEPDNPYFLTTWAYALASQQRFEDSLELLEQLNEEDIKSPQRAIYIASIYIDSGKIEAAKSLLEQVELKPQIPEEETLAEMIKAAIASQDSKE